uniref:Endonuclease/exonuclease/phosphatase domain-containing protein n=1 Tax=Glossina brevipalpis TaxID=37001 RepID=A0A1A9VZE7_9MUSC
MEIAFQIVSETRKGFQLCRFNALSFNKPTADYFSYLLFVLVIDVLCVNETWFRPYIDDGFSQISGYNHKIGARSGGDRAVEYLGVEIGGDTAKCLVMCAYNPHRTNCVDEVFSVMGELSILYEYIILSGDFNVDLQLNDGRPIA